MSLPFVDRRDSSGRATSSWWPLRWTSPLTGTSPQPISLFDVAELRAIVDTNRVAAELEPIRWIGRTDDDPVFALGSTPVRAMHFTQLRDAVADLWAVASLGALPEFQVGPIVPGTRVISIRDLLDLRTWIEAYEVACPDLAARVAWRYGSTLHAWPELASPLTTEQIIEMWDGVGHSIFWVGPDSQRTVELRRVDTTWYRVELDSNPDRVGATLSRERTARTSDRTAPDGWATWFTIGPSVGMVFALQ